MSVKKTTQGILVRKVPFDTIKLQLSPQDMSPT